MSQKQDKLTLGIEREIVIMKLIEHPNLLGLWDVYETSKELYVLLYRTRHERSGGPVLTPCVPCCPALQLSRDGVRRWW